MAKKTTPRKTAKRTAGKGRSRPAEDAAATIAAFAHSTPKPVLDTLFPKGAKIGGKKVFPLTLSSHCFLSELGNPAMEPGGIAKMSNEHLMEMCFVLTNPLHELVELKDDLIDGDDRRKWDRHILLECNEIPLEEIVSIGEVIGAVITQATQTMVPTAPKKKAQKP